MNTQTVPDNHLTVMETGITAQSAAAVKALKEGKIPQSALKQHPGKGGKTFTYISHIHGTKTMNDAFDQAWDWEVLKYDLLPDNSAVAQGRLTIYYFDGNNQIVHKRTITELGAREDTNGMNRANQILSAASRSLLRCLLRAFNYGAELYKNEDGEALTPEMAWKLLVEDAKKRGVTAEELGAHFKSAGFKKESLVDRFEEAWQECYTFCTNLKKEREAAKANKPETPKSSDVGADIAKLKGQG